VALSLFSFVHSVSNFAHSLFNFAHSASLGLQLNPGLGIVLQPRGQGRQVADKLRSWRRQFD
jgi:hypothetical protein